MFRACFSKPAVREQGVGTSEKYSDHTPPPSTSGSGRQPTARTGVPGLRPCASGVKGLDKLRKSPPSHCPETPDAEQTSGNVKQVPRPVGAGAGLNASRISLGDMQPENVLTCEARSILDGVSLSPRELGRGTYGIVVPGKYRGLPCAVKVMLSSGLDRAALRELLLGPSLVHPNVVSTYVSRCAHLTDEFFDFLEGGRRDREPGVPRVLEPLEIMSGDGFGDPLGSEGSVDPMTVLHQMLHALEAKIGQAVVVLVQQYCDRGTLESAIQRGAFRASDTWPDRLALRTLLRTAGELARGLLHLHDSGVVHGDMKPANVLLQSSKSDRRGFTAKVADFGLCHVLPQAAKSMFTDSWGSIAYMAPEAFTGKVSRATDVWAFGVMLWEMMAGVRPYSNVRQRDLADLIKAIKDGLVALQWPVVGAMWQPVVALGKRCLSHKPEDRPRFDVVVEELVAIERGIRAELLAPMLQEGLTESLELSINDVCTSGSRAAARPGSRQAPERA